MKHFYEKIESEDEKMAFSLAKRIISESEAVIVYTGAGWSAPSGAPTFRGAKGFWKAFPQYEKLGMNFQSMANPSTFEKDLPLALGFYGYRMNLYKKLTPHSGYTTLKSLFDSKKHGGFVVTSNVDGHTQRAGIENVLEEHGSINAWQCTSSYCTRKTGVVAPPEVSVDEVTMLGEVTEDHYCDCGNALRPNILMFMDGRFCEDVYYEQRGRYQKFKYGLQEKRTPIKVAVLEIGAGDDVSTMRVMASDTARMFDTKVIRVNMDREKETRLNRPIHLKGDAEQIVNWLVEGNDPS